VRVLDREGLAEVERRLPLWNGREYRRRLEAQARGLLVQAIAWDGDDPIGRAMILFPGHEEWSISAHRERCAEVRDVYVMEHARRRGAATALMERLEREAGARGFDRIGLMVGLDDSYAAARRLYESLGYAMAHGPLVSSVNLLTDDGPRPVFGVARYLVKTLSPRTVSSEG
jgi:GNAT superfamily N-acetyltransferase